MKRFTFNLASALGFFALVSLGLAWTAHLGLAGVLAVVLAFVVSAVVSLVTRPLSGMLGTVCVAAAFAALIGGAYSQDYYRAEQPLLVALGMLIGACTSIWFQTRKSIGQVREATPSTESKSSERVLRRSLLQTSILLLLAGPAVGLAMAFLILRFGVVQPIDRAHAFWTFLGIGTIVGVILGGPVYVAWIIAAIRSRD